MAFFDTAVLRGRVRLPTMPLCGKCGLYRECKSPKMKPSGRGGRRILVVGEAPGKQEDEVGEQFVGRAGDCLRRLLDGVGVGLDECHKTNAIICRPPGNMANSTHVECCRPNLMRTISELRPSVIILLGLSAVRSAVGVYWGRDVGQMSRWVGWTIPQLEHNAWLCPTYHPSYVVREGEEQALVRVVSKHLKRAVALESSRPRVRSLDEWKQCVRVICDPREAEIEIGRLSRVRGPVAFDYETTGLKPERSGHEIYSAAFAFEGSAISCRIDRGCHGALRGFLRSRVKKIAHNMKYEERWSRRCLNTSVRGWLWDTMLASHMLDNRKDICSLKFQAYVRFGVGDYDSSVRGYLEAKEANGVNRIREAPVKELLMYGGLDALFEYHLAMKQTKEMRNDAASHFGSL